MKAQLPSQVETHQGDGQQMKRAMLPTLADRADNGRFQTNLTVPKHRCWESLKAGDTETARTVFK